VVELLHPDLTSNKMPLYYKPSPRDLKVYYTTVDPKAVKIP
jgi:hypothetical protein